MLEMPLNAEVGCIDGQAGTLSHVILDPNGLKITHVVVKEKDDSEASDRLIPIENVAHVEASLVRLDCTLGIFHQFPVFSETRYVSYQYDDYTSRGSAVRSGRSYATPTAGHTEEVEEHIPEGLRALRSGAKVFAIDDHIGSVDELLLDPDSLQITHFTLQTGHFWGKRDIMLPLSAVSSATEDEVNLKLSKKEIGQLPAVPIKGKYRQPGAVGGYELIARIFDAPEKAGAMLEHVKTLQQSTKGAIKVHNAAVLVKDADGKTSITEAGELTPKKGRRIGALGGALLGALGGPIGIVIGAAAGAGLGNVTAKRWVDLGFPNEFLDRMETHLTPGSSALLLLTEREYAQSISDSLNDLGGIVLQHELTDEAVAEMLAEHDQGEA